MAAGSGRSGLRAFVAACRLQWQQWAATAVGSRSPLHLVLGNEASDLDSVACALVYAYHLAKQPRMAARLVLPLVNVPLAELPLRTEITHVLARLQLAPSELLSIHELDVPKLLAAGYHPLPSGSPAHPPALSPAGLFWQG
jgi:exopolyphosphatase